MRPAWSSRLDLEGRSPPIGEASDSAAVPEVVSFPGWPAATDGHEVRGDGTKARIGHRAREAPRASEEAGIDGSG
jgi:hypothetical protein